ncbi:MAG: undecaprenyl-phosphate glucose phosphotransferase, partial [Lachnospiraceae bacterium]
MIKDNQKHFNRLHVVIDAFVIAASFWTAWFIKFESSIFTNSVRTLSFGQYMRYLLVIVPGYLILYYAFNLYTAKRVQGRRLEAGNIIKANTIGLFLLVVGLYLIREIDFSRSVIFIFYFVNIIAETAVRNLIRYVLRDIRRRGLNQKHILLVGYSRAAEAYIDRIHMNPQWGYKIRGILDDNVPAGTLCKGEKVIGRIDNLLVILPANRLDEIVITLGLDEYFRLEHIVSLCEKSGVHTKFIPDYNSIIPTKPYTEDILGLPVVNIRYVPLTNSFNAILKRIEDILGAAVAIVLFSPVMLFAAVMVKATSSGPLIYKQERVGLHNRTFMMYKFRSMEVQPEQEEKKAWTVKNDPRVTNFGKFMRKTSIDELPQFFNVLKGDMSLVGPRPERSFFVEKFREEIPRYMVKHQVRPGITGWAQIHGYRGDTSIRKR